MAWNQASSSFLLFAADASYCSLRSSRMAVRSTWGAAFTSTFTCPLIWARADRRSWRRRRRRFGVRKNAPVALTQSC